MPEPSLLEPNVFRNVVSKIAPAANLMLFNGTPKGTTPYPFVQWEVRRGARTMATPNVPNSEAHVVPRLGISMESANLVYLREKKVFKPTTLHWLKAPGSAQNLRNAEEEVLKEVRDLNARFDNFWEWALWQCLQGSLVIDSPDVQASIDYKIPASHKVTAAEEWDVATPQEIVANIQAWKKIILRDGHVEVKTAYATSDTLNYIVTSFTRDGISLMSDRMKDEYFASGTLRGFMGMDWRVVDTMYDIRQTDGSHISTGFLPNNVVLFAELNQNNPLELVRGPSADDEAPDNFIGRFAKTWKEKDPSARQYLLEEQALPVLTRPEQIVVATVKA